MKRNQFLFLVFLVVCSSFSFGQKDVAITVSPEKFEEARQKNVFQFLFPDRVTAEDVALSAEYYTMYFSVDFNEESHVATIRMKDDTDRSKQIICRFFVSLDLDKVDFKGQQYSVDGFYREFMATNKK